MKMKEAFSTVCGIGLVLGSLLACKDPRSISSTKPETTSVPSLTYPTGSRRSGEACTASSECEGYLTCSGLICKGDTSTYAAPTPTPTATQSTARNSYKGEEFHSVYGTTKKEQWDFVKGAPFRNQNPNQICYPAKRVKTGTWWVACYDVSLDCLLMAPSSNFDPDGDNIGWDCNAD